MRMFFCQFSLKRWAIFLVMALFCMGIFPVTAISIDVTGDIQDWNLVLGSSNENSNTIKLNVSSTTSWTVGVKDALDKDSGNNDKNATSAGRMLEYNQTDNLWVDTGKVISSNLIVKGEQKLPIITDGGFSVDLGPNAQDIERGIETSGSPTGWNETAITVSQPLIYQDPPLTNGNKYHVVITFVATETG